MCAVLVIWCNFDSKTSIYGLHCGDFKFLALFKLNHEDDF